MERRFHSPYRFWVRGLVFEIAVFTGVITVLVLVGIASAWLFG